MASQNEIRATITKQIIQAIEGGKLPPWRRPWRGSKNSGHPANVVSKTGYRGINPLLLEIAADRHGFSSRFWGTFNQWSDMGCRVMRRPAHVKQGQWGTQVVFYKPMTKVVQTEDGEEEKSFSILRTYTVFNADQVDGADKYRVQESDNGETAVPDFEPADRLIEATKADIRFGGNRAFYSFTGDYIQMPPKSSFNGEWYTTILHELGHWTQHETRLNFRPSYAMAELTVEIGACYLASELGLPISDDLGNHAAYVKHWLKSMKDDPRFIFEASSQASKVSDYLLGYVAEPAETVMA